MSTNTKMAEALRDAATSLETIGRLAGKPYYGRDDQGEPIQTYMGHNDEVRSYAKSRAGCAYEALAAHDAEQAQEAQQTAGRASVDDWERELSAVMPADFKDWWQNSRREWPAVAAEVIKSLRRDRDAGWEVAARAQRREPLTDEQIAEGRYLTWAAEPEDAPEAWSFLRGARWAEKHFGIGATTGKEPGNA